MKEKILKKVSKLLANGEQSLTEKAQQYSVERMRLDKFLFAKEQVETSETTSWQWFVYCDFFRYPILSGKDAEEIAKFILGYNNDLLEKYLNE